MDDNTTSPAASGQHSRRDTVAGRLTGELPTTATPQTSTGRQHTTPAPPGNGVWSPPAATEQADTPRRTRVDLTRRNSADTARTSRYAPREARPRTSDETGDDDVPAGLEAFDLGSVPASVTPPTTWRRAAWFATASSGGVAGLLLAGAFLLGQQPGQQQGHGEHSYLERNDNAPLVAQGTQSPTREQHRTARVSPEPEQQTGPNTAGNERANAGMTATTQHRNEPTRVGRESTSSTTSDDAAGSGSTTGSATDQQAPDAPQQPQSPHETESPTTSNSAAAPETSVAKQHQWTLQHVGDEHDPEDLAQVSTEYLDTVAQNPEQAVEHTSGDLRQAGAAGLRDEYAEVAELEVREVNVRPTESVTENTVATTYEDGHTASETVRLTFDEDGNITHADR